MAETGLFNTVYNPDVLTCLANLSNDEVFTPPEIANAMLDMLPQELFRNPDTTFLDPACKSGVFLREIAKRLIKGLEPQIPDLQERLDHIYHKQLYGIAITELTSLLARRSLYCSKYPNSEFSVSKFENAQGNIRFKKIQHTWKDGNCIFCRITKQSALGDEERGESLEAHAYEFIHVLKPEEVFNMKFDVIISNPPYQLNLGNTSGNKATAIAIYHNFVSQAKKLKPHYISMIIPSRWMTRTAKGIPTSWMDEMVNDDHYEEIHDFIMAEDCFPGVDIKGGVNYFLWNREYHGTCKYALHTGGNVPPIVMDKMLVKDGVVIRDAVAPSIIAKIERIEGSDYATNYSFASLVATKDFWTNKVQLTSSWKGFKTERDSSHNIKCYVNKMMHKVPFGWIKESDIPKNREFISNCKVYTAKAAGSGSDSQVIGKPFLGEAYSVCTQTYMAIGCNDPGRFFSEEECRNIISYMCTKFFRYLVSVKKKTQDAPRGVFQFAPLQDFSKPWTDEELYKKYSLTKDEIDYIEASISPMNMEGE